MPRSLRDDVVCVRCAADLDTRATEIACSLCGQRYPRVGRISVLLPRPDDHVDMWRQQLGLLVAQGRDTLAAVEAEAGAPGVLPAAHERLRALAAGVRDQLDELAGLIGPRLGGPLPARSGTGLPRGVVEYSSFLYRDWAWETAGHGENQRAIEAIREILTDCDLGRVLVVGAGGCRLAYDLHRVGGTETAVVDIDPFLLLVAEAVIRGECVRLTEATASVQELARVVRTWTLAAPAGPLGDDAFHFFLANGLDPPFSRGAFDTIVTPWFIDQVPPDLPSFAATLRRLLRPGGRWINQGPLIYPAETPLSRRYSRDEVLDLAASAGFQVARWSFDSCAHLVSPLSGRGKVEPVLTFVGIADPAERGAGIRRELEIVRAR